MRRLRMGLVGGVPGALTGPIHRIAAELDGEISRRWSPILDAFDEAGVDVALEIHPGEHAFDDFAAGGSDRLLNARLMGIDA